MAQARYLEGSSRARLLCIEMDEGKHPSLVPRLTDFFGKVGKPGNEARYLLESNNLCTHAVVLK